MSVRPLNLAVLTTYGDDSRFGRLVAEWFIAAAEHYGGFEVDVVDLARADLPVLITRPADVEAERRLESVSPRLAAADAFIVITPEYNRSFPAVLKSAIDWHVAEWRAKPVGCVSYGGRSGGLRAIEQLRPVFAELDAVVLRDSVSLADVWDQFGPDGTPKDVAGCEGAAKTLLDQLQWWALALADARLARPFRA